MGGWRKKWGGECKATCALRRVDRIGVWRGRRNWVCKVGTEGKGEGRGGMKRVWGGVVVGAKKVDRSPSQHEPDSCVSIF